MSLDDELRSAFTQEALTRVAPPPDPDGLIKGGRARRRRRDLQRAGAGAAAAVLVAAGGWGLLTSQQPAAPGPASRAPGPTSGSTPLPPQDHAGREGLQPGTYRTFVGLDATGRRIEADLTVRGGNWSSGDFPLVSERFGSVFAGVGVYQPRALAAGRGCLEDPTTPVLARTPRRLANQLARLPRSTVLAAPAPTRANGWEAQHLRLRIGVECADYYRVAETPGGERGITYTAPGAIAEDVVIDFWVLDVDGALVVVDEWHNVGASDALVAQAAQARGSISFVEP